MSYANGTTHYNLPQTVGTDKRDWFDTNQAFADIDEALYGAVQQSTSTAAAVTALTTRVGEAESDIATIQASQSTDEANIAALQTLVNQHTTEIADVKADALDMICAVDEGTAQVATVAVAEGNYFRYNDVLYIATANIAIGDTIVPNTNCRATNVATELATESVSVVTDGVKSYSTLFTELGNLINYSKLNANSNFIMSAGGGSTNFECQQYGTNFVQLVTTRVSGYDSVQVQGLTIGPDENLYTRATISATGNVVEDRRNEIPAAGITFKLTY